jgi:hypothetical protein
MKIERLIERNVFTFLWLFFFISRLFVYFIGGEYEYEYEKYFYSLYTGKYICWPYIFLFPGDDYSMGDAIITCAIGLLSFIAVDYLWRKIFWNKKKDITPILSERLNKTPKILVLQIIIGLIKWASRLFACFLIPFLMFIVEGCINRHAIIELTGLCIAIFGFIISWRFLMVGALMMLIGVIPFEIHKVLLIFIVFDLTAAAFFATWALRKFSERTLKKNDMVQL